MSRNRYDKSNARERFWRSGPLRVLQARYNLFERGIATEVLPYYQTNSMATLGCNALCCGLLGGPTRADTTLESDDLRRLDGRLL